MPSDDETLLQDVRKGDTQAFARFLNLRQPQLLAYIQRQLGPGLRRKIEPEDVFQEVSLDCVRALPDVNLTDRDPFKWMCQMAERRIIDAHRHFFEAQKRAADREVPLGSPGADTGQAGLIDLLVASMTSPSQAFSRDQREFRLQQAIEQLPEDNCRALQLRYVENLPTKEIAERLNKTDVAVRVMLTRSLKKLESLLDENS